MYGATKCKLQKNHIQDLAAASSSKNDATAAHLDISMSDNSLVIHSSKERLLCSKIKFLKIYSHLFDSCIQNCPEMYRWLNLVVIRKL